ncbi:YqjF family protein [Mycolicibacterium sediminis]|uniref:DUF2071 domain-containing protein n=1 Tax=Mycolicibacterium sediminis TaxID=1286180 RepID=A0A7I7QJN1_9MYCO|nr:DUF2071 domain-containing protein [Mycolicibacterium sediminis]BBY26464.1 hypothetical protein MSEDJ_05600 [Mycolicibacterium sediminis]
MSTSSDPLATYPVAAPSVPPPVFTSQRWSELTFLHWPVDPEAVAHLYPEGTRPDVFADGHTYVGLIPFAMRELAFVVPAAVPYFGDFLETNVRLYSTDDAGRHGVLFRSLETERLAMVALSRAMLGIPYTWARMRMHRNGNRVTYLGTRRWPDRGVASEIVVDVGAPVEPTPLETWLTARWGAHTRKAGRTWWVPNEHAPWVFRAADVVRLDDDLVAAAGVTPVGEPLRALYSEGTVARFGRPSLV